MHNFRKTNDWFLEYPKMDAQTDKQKMDADNYQGHHQVNLGFKVNNISKTPFKIHLSPFIPKFPVPVKCCYCLKANIGPVIYS